MTHTISIFGEIGNAVSADTIRAQLASLTPGTTLSVEINSEGGSVSEAIAIYNLLRTWGAPVEVTITGWALSAATIVAMAGSRISMHTTSLMMVHAPWLSASGNAQELRQQANALDQVAQAMRAAYRRTQQSTSVIDTWLDGNDHWFTADQALEAGLVDEVIEAPAYATGAPILAACRFPVPPEIRERIATMNAPVNPEEIRAAALAEDRARRQEIRSRTQAFAQRPGVPALLQTLEDDPAMTADQAANRVLAHLGKDATPTCRPGAFPSVETPDNRSGELRAAAQDMLMMRAGLRVNDPHPAVRDIQRLNIVALAERFVSMAGKNCAGMGKGDVVRAALTTSDFPLLLTGLTARSLRAGYQAAPATHTVWTGEREVADFRTQTLAQLSEAPSLEEVREAGEYTFGSFAEAAETFAVKTFGKIVRFTRQALINDDLGALTTVPAAQGAAARRLEADLVYSKLTANPKMADGTDLFHGDHGNLVSATALSVSSLSVARAAMRSQKGLNGLDFLDPQPRYLLVPVALETTAEQLVASTVDPSKQNDTQNPGWIRGLQVVADPRLDADSTISWYLAAAPSQIEGIVRAYLVGEGRPFLDQKEGWEVDSTDYKVRLDVGVGVIDWRALVKNPGA